MFLSHATVISCLFLPDNPHRYRGSPVFLNVTLAGTLRDTVGLVKRESSQELGMIQEELDSRLQELEKAYQASLNELGQALLLNEKKLQEKHHEPVSGGTGDLSFQGEAD